MMHIFEMTCGKTFILGLDGSLSPCISNSQDQEGEKTVEEELVPVVGPLHVDLVLAQPGHGEGRATL